MILLRSVERLNDSEEKIISTFSARLGTWHTRRVTKKQSMSRKLMRFWHTNYDTISLKDIFSIKTVDVLFHSAFMCMQFIGCANVQFEHWTQNATCTKFNRDLWATACIYCIGFYMICGRVVAICAMRTRKKRSESTQLSISQASEQRDELIKIHKRWKRNSFAMQ